MSLSFVLIRLFWQVPEKSIKLKQLKVLVDKHSSILSNFLSKKEAVAFLRKKVWGNKWVEKVIIIEIVVFLFLIHIYLFSCSLKVVKSLVQKERMSVLYPNERKIFRTTLSVEFADTIIPYSVMYLDFIAVNYLFIFVIFITY